MKYFGACKWYKGSEVLLENEKMGENEVLLHANDAWKKKRENEVLVDAIDAQKTYMMYWSMQIIHRKQNVNEALMYANET